MPQNYANFPLPPSLRYDLFFLITDFIGLPMINIHHCPKLVISA